MQRFLTAEQLRKGAERLYGLPFDEALEMAYDNAVQEIEALSRWFKRLSPDDLTAGRILRGHTKNGCRCRYCKSVAANRQILPSPEEAPPRG